MAAPTSPTSCASDLPTPSSSTRERIPPHLRCYIVHHAYERYRTIDQAVWRFVLLQNFARLQSTAHPTYGEGLQSVGMSVDEIPHIDAMDARLQRFGWGAVCVDGYIPPRAFVEFQKLKILPIAAEIRTSEHLSYTPAPDIIHEAAGHAPIIPNPVYRDYLQKFGAVGDRAFSSAADRKVFEAVRNLSIVMEDGHSSQETIAKAHQAVEAAKNETDAQEVTEAVLMGRLHWWTIEYGLVASPLGHKIYGAGLLSSVAEAVSCLQPPVKHLPLSLDCVDVEFDITKPQPQLFVAQDFDHLHQVLGEFAPMLAYKAGGALAIQRFIHSEEVGTACLNSDVQIIGQLARAWMHTPSQPQTLCLWQGPVASGQGLKPADNNNATSPKPIYLGFDGPCALAIADTILGAHTQKAHPQGFGCPIGVLDDGTPPHTLDPKMLQKRGTLASEAPNRCRFRFKSGVQIDGIWQGAQTRSDLSPTEKSKKQDTTLIVQLKDCTVSLPNGDIVFQPEWGIYDWALASDVSTCHAGPADLAYWPSSQFSAESYPPQRTLSGKNAALAALYQQAVDAWRQDLPSMVTQFSQIHTDLCQNHPEEWLLRWNILECLVKADRHACDLAQKIIAELSIRAAQEPSDGPLAFGLSYLGLMPQTNLKKAAAPKAS